VTMLSHYMNNKGIHMTDEDKGQTDQKCCMHKHKNVTCYKYGKKGHYANKCPSGDSDDNELLSTRPSTKQPQQQQQTKPHWMEWLV
jgi:hypothetical protein